MTKKSRGEEVKDIVEIETQEYFESLAGSIATASGLINKDDAQVIRSSLGVITFREFVHYVTSQGYTVEE